MSGSAEPRETLSSERPLRDRRDSARDTKYLRLGYLGPPFPECLLRVEQEVWPAEPQPVARGDKARRELARGNPASGGAHSKVQSKLESFFPSKGPS